MNRYMVSYNMRNACTGSNNINKTFIDFDEITTDNFEEFIDLCKEKINFLYGKKLSCDEYFIEILGFSKILIK